MEKKNLSQEAAPILSDEELTSQLAKYKALLVLGKLLVGAGVVVTGISLFTGMIPGVVVGILLAIIGSLVSQKASGAIKTRTSSNLVRAALESVFDNVDYQPFRHLSSSQIYSAGMAFPFSFDEIEGSDCVKAVYKGLNIEMSDISLVSVTTTEDENGMQSESRSTVFQGLWMICDFGKTLSAEVKLSKRSKLDRLFRSKGIQTESEEFNKRFCIQSESPVEAFYILTPHMMEYILGMQSKGGGDVYMSFLREGRVHIAINSGRDSFEAEKGTVNAAALREKFVGEIRYITDLIDELRLVDTLYQKEGTV